MSVEPIADHAVVDTPCGRGTVVYQTGDAVMVEFVAVDGSGLLRVFAKKDVTVCPEASDG